jgi:hypothetical protein
VATATFEAFALFEIMDRASPTLRLLSEQMERLDALTTQVAEKFEALGRLGVSGLTRSLDAAIWRVEVLNRESERTGRLGVGVGTGAAGPGVRSDGGTAERAESMLPAGIVGMGNVEARRRAERAAAAAEERMAADAGDASTVAARAASHSRLAHARMGFPIGPVHMTGWPSLTAVAIAAPPIIGGWEAIKLKSGLAPLIAGQNLPAVQEPQVEQIVKNIAAQTGFDYGPLTEATRAFYQQTSRMTPQEHLETLPMTLRYAAVEEYLKGVPLASAVEAEVGIMHMYGKYSPAQMQQLFGEVAVASTRTPLTLDQLSTALGYSAAGGALAGIGPENMIAWEVALSQAHLRASRIGTGIDALIREMSPGGGLATLMTGHADLKKLTATYRVGLTDIVGRPTGLAMLEQGNFVGFSRYVHQHLMAIPETERAGILAQAVGPRAARVLDITQEPQFAQNVEAARQQIRQLAGENVNTIISTLVQNSPMVQLRILEMSVINLLQTLAGPILPEFSAAIQGLTAALQAITPSSSSSFLGRVETGAAKWAAGGATLGASLGLLAGPGGILPGAGAGLLIGGAVGAAAGGIDWLYSSFGHDVAQRRESLSLGLISPARASTDLPATSRTLAHADGGGLVPGGVNFSGNTINVYADTQNPEEHADKILDAINRKIKDGITHNIGAGSGVLSSPWTSGLGVNY